MHNMKLTSTLIGKSILQFIKNITKIVTKIMVLEI